MSGVGEGRELRAERGEPGRRGIRHEQFARQRLEREHGRFRPDLARLAHDAIEQRPVSSMDAVEAADGDDRIRRTGARVADDARRHRSCLEKSRRRKPTSQSVPK